MLRENLQDAGYSKLSIYDRIDGAFDISVTEVPIELIASDVSRGLTAMLEGFDWPAILVTPDYRILAANQKYRDSFGEIDLSRPALCHRVSHGYDVPCDQAGESCPLAAAKISGSRERVLHIHQTPRGREHVDVEMLPIHDDAGALQYFVELLKPVPIASARSSATQMVGSSPAFNRLVEHITRVGPTEASVLLLGESGVGKELAALAIHQASRRSDRPMVTLECTGLTETLFESELFGHVKGAFTGASFNTSGLAEAANGGTLFLDEVGDIPLGLQVKLLRLLETGSYRPVGSREVKRTDFRLVCATNRDLGALVRQGLFRDDLYYRINVFPIMLPSLAQRIEDIPLLAKSILQKLDDSGRYRITDSATRALQNHRYVGNIRELRNILFRALVLAHTPVIDGDVIKRSLAIETQTAGADPEPQPLYDLKTNEKRYLDQLLRHFEGDKGAVARTAGISLRSLYRKL